jgi:hypothetical protein
LDSPYPPPHSSRGIIIILIFKHGEAILSSIMLSPLLFLYLVYLTSSLSSRFNLTFSRLIMLMIPNSITDASFPLSLSPQHQKYLLLTFAHTSLSHFFTISLKNIVLNLPRCFILRFGRRSPIGFRGH